MDPLNDLLASSIVVHEMVHYLQAVARGEDALEDGAAFGSIASCKLVVQLEYEAYGVQQRYILQYGSYIPVGLSMRRVACADTSSDEPLNSAE